MYIYIYNIIYIYMRTESMPRRWPMKRVLMDDLGRESVDVISSFGWTRKVEAAGVAGVLRNRFCYIRAQ